MVTKRLLTILPQLLVVLSCASPLPHQNPPSTRNPLLLSLVERLLPGVTDEGQTEKSLGPPDRIIPPDSGRKFQYWLYFEEPYRTVPRLSLAFDSTHSLHSITWSVRGHEPEATLSKAESRYPNARFAKQPIKWLNRHTVSDQIRYEDAERGLTIACNSTTDRVNAISWAAPERPMKAQAHTR